MSIPTIPCSRWAASFRKVAAWLVLLIFVTGCGTDRRWDVPASVEDLKDNWRPVDIRFLLDSMALESEDDWVMWQRKTGPFGIHYVEEILRIGAYDELQTAQALQDFSSNDEIRAIDEAIDSISGSPSFLPQQLKDLHRAFNRFEFFFPEERRPQVYCMNSGFNHAVYPIPGALGIGLEWYLGSEHPITQSLPPHLFPQYMRERMDRRFLVSSAFRGWLLVHFSQSWYLTNRCADEMIFWGKMLFIMEKCFPKMEKHLLLDWSEEDWLWAQENEQAIWLELQPQRELFNTNRMEFGRWFNEGPFTRAAGIPQESPDRLGAYMGWRMASDYMRKNPDATLRDLLIITDPTPIIKAYRPK